MIGYMKYHNMWSLLILLEHIIRHDIVNCRHKTISKKSIQGYAHAVKLHAPPVNRNSEIMYGITGATALMFEF